jgi:plastocyanin domain-containing protein
MKRAFLISAILTIASVAGMVMLLRRDPAMSSVATGSTNVSMVDGKQVIRITAKGGYAPRNTVAKANIPTTLNVETNGTFDCSSALVIPRVQYRASLPPSGTTTIDLPPQQAGTTIQGVCAMGMYGFAIAFE